MSKKCRAYSQSKLGTEALDNRKAFYAGWDAALRTAPSAEPTDAAILAEYTDAQSPEQTPEEFALRFARAVLKIEHAPSAERSAKYREKLRLRKEKEIERSRSSQSPAL